MWVQYQGLLRDPAAEKGSGLSQLLNSFKMFGKLFFLGKIRVRNHKYTMEINGNRIPVAVEAEKVPTMLYCCLSLLSIGLIRGLLDCVLVRIQCCGSDLRRETFWCKM